LCSSLRLMDTLACLPQKPRENTVIINSVAEGTPDLIPQVDSYRYMIFQSIS
jgi:hypothetical protein